MSVANSYSMEMMKEYLQKFSWDSECWGESNVANFMKYEDELVEQCLQTPVNQDMRLRAVQAPPAQVRIGHRIYIFK